MFGNSVKWGHMSVKFRSDMMIKTNMILFPQRGVKLNPNLSRRDLRSITQEHTMPRRAQGLGLYQPNSSNLIYKRKSGNVLLPGRTFVYQSSVTLSHCLREVYSNCPCLDLRKKRRERRGGGGRKGGRPEREQGMGQTETTYTIDILWPLSQADSLCD